MDREHGEERRQRGREFQIGDATGGTVPEEDISTTVVKEFDLPKRQGAGEQGRPITLTSNFYVVRNFAQQIIHYDVEISEGKRKDRFPKDLNLSVIEELVRLNRHIFQDRPVYDGKKSLYSKDELDLESQEFHESKVDDESWNVAVMEGGRQRKFKVKIKLAAKINMGALHQAVIGKQRLLSQEPIVVLDIVMHYAATIQKTAVGSRFFTPDNANDLGMGRQIWKGYYQSARQGCERVLLNINMVSSVFLRAMPVLHYLREITKHNENEGVLSDVNKRRFTREIKNVKIYATHKKYKRKYCVNDLTRHGASTQTFPMKKDGTTIWMTVENYFQEELDYSLEYPDLPCLHVGKKNSTVYLPMEVCEIVEGQRTFHRLTETQKSDMIRHTAMSPSERFRKIHEIKSTNFRNEWMRTFEVTVGSTLLDVPARILQRPVILYGQSETLQPHGAWNMVGRTLYEGAAIESWGLVVYGRFPRNRIDHFKASLWRVATNMGIWLGDCHFQRFANDREPAGNLVTEALKNAPTLKLLVVILPGKTPLYADLKRICETENGSLEITDNDVQQILKKTGLATQCIQAKNAIKCNNMTLAQICLKINSKMGGANNAIFSNTITRPPEVFKELVMFLGAGVTHPGPGDKLSPSIGAVVGSIDDIPSRYAAAVRILKRKKKGNRTLKEEIIKDLGSVTIELLRAFCTNSKAKPKKIIMFRDGVSEGQFQEVLLHEMRAIQIACKEFEKGYQPAITFIVTIKRHHARFKILNRGDGDRSGNCQPGTTIDKEVCHPTQFDYYQYGHAGIQDTRTSRPTKYHVLWDENNFTADEIQALSFKLCHLYARCTHSVSLPAPAYYADLLATRAMLYLTKDDGGDAASIESTGSDEFDQTKIKNLQEIIKPHPNLANRMFFV